MILKKRTPENSIILAKRYRGSQSSIGTISQTSSSTNSRGDNIHYNLHNLPEGYIQEHYSPKLHARKLTKSTSVDTINTKRGKPLIENYINIANNPFSSNVISKFEQQRDIKKVQFSTDIKNEPKRQPTNLVKKFFNKFNPVTYNTTTTTATTNTTTTIDDNNIIEENQAHVINQEVNHEEEQQPLIINRKQFKHDGTLKVNLENKIREDKFIDSSYQRLAKEKIKLNDKVKLSDNKREKKLKYSPPPEDKPHKIADINKNLPKITTAITSTTDVNKTISDKTKTYRVSSYMRGINYDCCTRYITNMFGNGLKLKERFVIAVCVAVVLFTLLLVIDVQMDFGMSGHHLAASHGKIRYVQNKDGPESAYNSFRKRFLQKTHR